MSLRGWEKYSDAQSTALNTKVKKKTIILSKLGLPSCFSLLKQMYTKILYLLSPHTLPIILFYYPLLHYCNSTKNLSHNLQWLSLTGRVSCSMSIIKCFSSPLCKPSEKNPWKVIQLRKRRTQKLFFTTRRYLNTFFSFYLFMISINRAKKRGWLGGRIIMPRNVGKNSQITYIHTFFIVFLSKSTITCPRVAKLI